LLWRGRGCACGVEAISEFKKEDQSMTVTDTTVTTLERDIVAMLARCQLISRALLLPICKCRSRPTFQKGCEVRALWALFLRG
jgi:hypothetical protein